MLASNDEEKNATTVDNEVKYENETTEEQRGEEKGEVEEKNRMFIVNLDFTTTKELLLNHLKKYVNIKNIVMFKNNNNKFNGRAAVDLESQADASSLQEKFDRTEFQGRIIRVLFPSIQRKQKFRTKRTRRFHNKPYHDFDAVKTNKVMVYDRSDSE